MCKNGEVSFEWRYFHDQVENLVIVFFQTVVLILEGIILLINLQIHVKCYCDKHSDICFASDTFSVVLSYKTLIHSVLSFKNATFLFAFFRVKHNFGI